MSGAYSDFEVVSVPSSMYVPRVVGLPEMASRLNDAFFNPDGSAKTPTAEELPNIPDQSLPNLVTDEQKWKFKQDSATSLDVAKFVAKLALPDSEEKLKTVNYSYQDDDAPDSENFFWRVVHDKIFSSGLAVRKADNAIVQYFGVVGEIKDAHLHDPNLSELRRYRRQSQLKANSPFDLSRSYTDGLDAICGASRDLSAFCIKNSATRLRRKNRFTQPTPEVMRASMPAIRFLAASALANNMAASKNTFRFADFFIYDQDRYGQERVSIDRKKYERQIRRSLKPRKINKDRIEFINHPRLSDRTNNTCPALAPVRGLASKGAIESIYMQEIEILEDAGIWAQS